MSQQGSERPPQDPFTVDKLSDGQFHHTSLYTNARTELIESRAVPSINLTEYMWIHSLQLQGHERIIEPGCGDGRSVQLGAESGHKGEIVGIDISPSSFAGTAEVLRQHPNIRFEQGDIRDLSRFPDNYFQRASVPYMLYHVGEPERALEELKRVTDHEAILVFITRGDHHFIRSEAWAGVVLASMGYQAMASPYLNFDAEDAPAMLSDHFTVVPELSMPTAFDRPLTRDLRLQSEDWSLYSLSLYGIVLSAVVYQHQLQGTEMPPNAPALIRATINDIVKRDFDNEIRNSPTHTYLESGQDRLIACINNKL